ncbi:MAG: iron-containing alcohol dehydrogenase [Treponema sp.]|jgi:alcohol dehydrogenase|nr:iron-containing alcohol dehydrogenase [Treponema sp.]
MDDIFGNARKLLSAWKGDSYVFGCGVLSGIGGAAAKIGKNPLVICNKSYLKSAGEPVTASLQKAGLFPAGGAIVSGAGPNAPRADVYRIETWLLHHKPDLIVAVGGGSTIDCAKAANFLSVLGKDISPEIDPYFGTGLVTEALKKTGKKLIPLMAIQTSASSGAHLTKYSNVTDPMAGQKKLVVDDALVPDCAFFDYAVTASMPRGVTIDGALDGIAHCFEVFSGIPKEKYDLAASITECALELTVQYAPRVINNPQDIEAREAIGLATDLGGYAIMVGGTSGGHLTSFSLVDLAGHGTACGIMNPYYAVFFSPAIEKQLRHIGGIFRKYGYISERLEYLSGRELGIAVATGMVAFSKAIGAPATLGELPKYKDSYITKALEAAKDSQLEMKLKNMPVPLTAANVEEYMGPILRAAVGGDFSLIKPAS